MKFFHHKIKRFIDKFQSSYKKNAKSQEEVNKNEIIIDHEME
jgi:hypothetical protein